MEINAKIIETKFNDTVQSSVALTRRACSRYRVFFSVEYLQENMLICVTKHQVL